MQNASEYKIHISYTVDDEPQSELPLARFAKAIDNARNTGVNVEFSDATNVDAEGLKLIKLTLNDEDEYLSEDSSSTLKTAFKEYFAAHGVPEDIESLQDAGIKFVATTFNDEFGEACEEFESEPTISI